MELAEANVLKISIEKLIELRELDEATRKGTTVEIIREEKLKAEAKERKMIQEQKLLK
jgi:hypothetical protein